MEEDDDFIASIKSKVYDSVMHDYRMVIEDQRGKHRRRRKTVQEGLLPATDRKSSMVSTCLWRLCNSNGLLERVVRLCARQ